MIGTLLKEVIRYLSPPRGGQVRRFCSIASFGLGMLYWTNYGTSEAIALAQMDYASPRAYALVFFTLAALLLLTSWRYRYSLPGRVICVLGAGYYTLFASTFWPLALSGVWIYALIGYALLGEAGGHEYD